MARDLIHEAVKSALKKDGWIVTDDPFYLVFEEDDYISIDLGAENKIMAEKDAVKIAAKKAKLKDGDFKTKFYPQPKGFFQEFFDKKEDEAEAKLMQAQFGDLAPYVKQLKVLKSREGVMTLMPEVIDFK